MMEEKEEIKKSERIEIVQGDSHNLNISDVRDNLTFEVHDNDATKKGEIIVPENQRTTPTEFKWLPKKPRQVIA